VPAASRAAPAGPAARRWLAAASTLALAALGVGLAAATTPPGTDLLGGLGWPETLGLLLLVVAAVGWLQVELWYGSEGKTFDLLEAALGYLPLKKSGGS
jgi:hypothetical protein